MLTAGWGERTTSTPSRGYCANLGHPEDETGLVYMRARYYEPTTGRFISEDPARDGVNWYLYANGDAVNKVDVDGKVATEVFIAIVIALYASVSYFWQPNSAYGKAAKSVIEGTLILLGIIDAVSLSIDYGLKSPDIRVHISLALADLALAGVSSVVMLSAAYQLSLLVFMATEGDYGLWGEMAGSPTAFTRMSTLGD